MVQHSVPPGESFVSVLNCVANVGKQPRPVIDQDLFLWTEALKNYNNNLVIIKI